jgi:hypothetical protein
MIVLAVSFLMALLLGIKPYMAKNDYQDEIERMAKYIDGGVVMCAFYKQAKRGLTGEVVIHRQAEDEDGKTIAVGEELVRSRQFFVGELGVTQNHHVPNEIYSQMKRFSDQFRKYVEESKALSVIDRLSIIPDPYEEC